MYKIESPWIGFLGFLIIGIWWAIFPNSAAKFYRKFGVSYPSRVSPIFLRVSGVLFLLCGIVIGTFELWRGR